MKALLAKQAQEVQQLLKRRKVAAKAKFDIRRLEAWGEKFKNEQLNTEWPTKELLDQMDPDVKLKSFAFKKVGTDAISSVCCTLSNGWSSGVVESAGVDHKMP